MWLAGFINTEETGTPTETCFLLNDLNAAGSVDKVECNFEYSARRDCWSWPVGLAGRFAYVKVSAENLVPDVSLPPDSYLGTPGTELGT